MSKNYSHRFVVNAPLDAVAAFHKDSRALRWLSPPSTWVKFNRVEPLGEGSIADFTMWLGPIPVHWVAVHSDVRPNEGFIDTQQKGPFRSWRHKHIFRPLDVDKTEVIDEIEAEPGGLLSWMMWLTLPVLFAYRGWQTRRRVGKMLET